MPARVKQQPSEAQHVERVAYSITEFACAHGLSRAHVYNLLKNGCGPRVIHAGRRTLISREAAAEWRKQMEARCGR